MGGINDLVGGDDLVGLGDLFMDLLQLVNFGLMGCIQKHFISTKSWIREILNW